MKNKSELALKKFSEGYNCSQSILYTYCDYLGLDRDLALRIACGLGSGMGRNQEVCGAVTGGILVIGLKFGRGDLDGPKATEVTYKKTRELMEQFSEKNGSYLCRKLLDHCDLKTDEGQKEFKEKDLLNKTCKPCVKSVVEILDGLL